MKRREVGRVALGGLMALALVSARAGNGQVKDGTVASGPLPFQIGEAVTVGVASRPVVQKGVRYSLVTANRITFRREGASHLTAKLQVAVRASARADYLIRVTIRDADGKLLAVAAYQEAVRHIEVGRVPIISHDLPLDFGDAAKLSTAATFHVSIQEWTAPRDTDSAPTDRK